MQEMRNGLSLADHYKMTSKRIRKGSGVGSAHIVKVEQMQRGKRDESGQVIVDDEGICKRWKAYFSDLLQEGTQGQSDNQLDREEQLEEEVERVPIIAEEVEVAISKLKNGKSPGICGISAEMLKSGRMVVVKWLHRIMCLAWENGQVPEDWQRAVIVPVHKKGRKLKCENYRGISLLSIPSKVYARILDERTRDVTESKVLEAQFFLERAEVARTSSLP